MQVLEYHQRFSSYGTVELSRTCTSHVSLLLAIVIMRLSTTILFVPVFHLTMQFNPGFKISKILAAQSAQTSENVEAVHHHHEKSTSLTTESKSSLCTEKTQLLRV